MNELTTLNNVMTMTSREIAELTGKRHDNVMADIRKMLTELHGEGGLLSFQESYLNAQNKPQPMYSLPKRETLILVSGYSITMRAKIIDRWQELEAQPAKSAFNIPTTLSAALRLAADQADTISKMHIEIEVMVPVVKAFERIAESEGLLRITDAAKALGMQPQKLFTWMSFNDWTYRRPGGAHWCAYQARLKSGHLKHKVTTVLRPDGTEKIVEQVLVTPKGLTKLAESLTQ